jgi:hypothetical protein
MAWMFTNETACNEHTDELSCRGSVSNCAWNEELTEDNAGTAADPDSSTGGFFTRPVDGAECVGTPPEEGGVLNSQPALDAQLLVMECLLLGSTQSKCSALKIKGCAWDGSDCVANSTMRLRHFLHKASKTPFTKALVAEQAECSSRTTKAACVLASELVEVSPGTFQQNLLQAESGKASSDDGIEFALPIAPRVEEKPNGTTTPSIKPVEAGTLTLSSAPLPSSSPEVMLPTAPPLIRSSASSVTVTLTGTLMGAILSIIILLATAI